jgi:SH3-like domain-containing protein
MTVATQTIRPIALAAILASIVSGSQAVSQAWAAGEAAAGSASGLPVPRYVSLKSDRVNVRTGPTKDHEVAWVFTRPGLPVEITAEFENWRRIRDAEGSEGWVYHSLLSGRRTAVVTARDKDQLIAVSENPVPEGEVTAKLQPGVVAQVRRCDGKWCRVNGKSFDGWVPQERLWGVYPNEKVD